jgi:hypothetical protein
MAERLPRNLYNAIARPGHPKEFVLPENMKPGRGVVFRMLKEILI